MRFTVIVDRGEEIEVEAETAEAAMQEAVERGHANVAEAKQKTVYFDLLDPSTHHIAYGRKP